ncbi:hypothetical protein K3495_g5894 [Podosphaera aphanis]|nr:hypothetical protein K3495_g5894 [Podosphaera aphanis]
MLRDFLSTIPRSDIQLYSDGSKLPNGNAGSGFVAFQIGVQVCAGAYPLGKHKEPVDAEAFAVLQGIRAAATLPTARFSKDLWICIDNEEIASKHLRRILITSSQPIFLQALEAAELWKSRPRLPHILEGQIHIRWVPGHVGIKGNELADLEAKKGAAMPSPHPPEYSFSSLKRWHTEQTKIAREKWWHTSRPPAYTQLKIANTPIFPRELLCRKDLGRVVAAKTGHGDFAAYHTRFRHEDATLNCLCGSTKSPIHFLFCRILRRRDGHPTRPISTLVPHLLGAPEGALTLCKWLGQSRFFQEICLR